MIIAEAAKARLPFDMVWVSVDGLEGAGKTTLVRCLARRFKRVHLLPEFSTGFAGKALASAVKQSPHYISHSAVAQSLFFLGEYVEKIEDARSRIEDARVLVIADRGLLSKIAYQTAVLRPILGTKKTQRLLADCLAGLPVPDLTVWLSIKPQIAKIRIRRRGAERRGPALEFMTLAAEEFKKAAAVHGAQQFDTGVATAQEVCKRVGLEIAARWPSFLK